MMNQQKILVIGSFKNKADDKHSTTAAEQLADLFISNNIEIITTTTEFKKIPKFFDTLKTIYFQRKNFSIAIVPLYGTAPSFLWQQAATKLLRFLNKKIILIVHGGSIPQQLQSGKKFFLNAMQRANIVVAPSPFFKTVLQQYAVDAVVIPNVLNLSNYAFQNKNTFAPNIMWMRSFSKVYNPFMAINVAVNLKKKYPFFKMIMAGTDGGLFEATKKLAEQNDVQNNILFPGYISTEQKNKLAIECDIYINTNNIDNAPVSVIEFMALGLPVISTNCGGIPYIIKNNENGLLVDVNDAEAMANKIEKIITDQQFAKTISQNAFQYSRQYGEEIVFKKWMEVLNKLNN